jgi:hypothetical protein
MPVGTKNKRIILTEGTPALVTNLPAMALKEDQSPSVTGISTTAEGFLQKGTLPAAVTNIIKQYTIGTTVYDWYYNCLWRIDNSGTTPKVVHGAPEYTATYYRQGTGEVECRDTTANILKILPFGNGNIAVFKSDGGYIINNANSQAGNFQRGDFIQEMKISTATHAIELDEVCYFVNTQGLFTVKPDGSIEEISFLVRGATRLVAAALSANYAQKIVRIGTGMAYDVERERFYDYGVAFAYTSRRLAGDNDESFSVNRAIFEYDLSDASLGEIQFQTQVEARGWSQTITKSMRSTDTKGNQNIDVSLEKVGTGMSFQLRIVSMSANMKIKRIYVAQEGLTTGSRRN